MIGMLSSVGINIILDPILIFGLHLDVVGRGTAISNAIAALFFIIYFSRKMKPYHLMLNMPNQLKR